VFTLYSQLYNRLGELCKSAQASGALLDNSANKHAEQPRFFSCFTSDSCSLAKYTALCMVWQPNIRNMLRAFGGGASPRGGTWRLPVPLLLPTNPGYATARSCCCRCYYYYYFRRHSPQSASHLSSSGRSTALTGCAVARSSGQVRWVAEGLTR